MTTQFTLNTWKTYTLFLPGVLGFLFIELSMQGAGNYTLYSSIANVLWVLGMLLLLSVQAYFTYAFDKATVQKLRLPSINALFPVAFFTFYFIYVLYSALAAPIASTETATTLEPVRDVNFGTSGTLIMCMLIYSAASFLFINNVLVKWRILQYEDIKLRQELQYAFLRPMKKLVAATIYIGIGVILFSITYDIVKIFL